MDSAKVLIVGINHQEATMKRAFFEQNTLRDIRKPSMLKHGHIPSTHC